MEEGAAHWLFMRTPHAYTSGDSLLRCCKAHGGISRSDDHAHLPRDNNRASALLPCATIHAQSAPAPQNGAPHERHAASGSDAAEIGRASWRERGWQNGCSSGGAVSLNKKKKQKQ